LYVNLLVLEANVLTNFCETCSLLAGLTATIMGTPADVVKTRVMNQPTENGKGLYYKNSIDCLQKTIKNEGFLALYKGFLPIW